MVQHPYPKEEGKYLGWEFWTAMGTSFAGLTLAAFRTAQAFFLAAVFKGDFFLALAESFAAVFAIEGSVVLFALQQAREKNKTDAKSSQWGLWVAFSVSVLAGLFQSMNIILTPNDTVSLLLSWTLVVAMGVGATVIAWLGGDILGVHLVRLELVRKEAKEQFIRTVHSYRANMLKEWRSSLEQGAVNSSKRSRYRVREPNREPSSRTVHEPDDEPHPPISMDELNDIFNSTFASTGAIAGVGETARELMRRRNPDGSDDGWENLKSRVSGARKKWMAERNISQVGE